MSDGSEVTVGLTGDESFHFYTTVDGYPIIELNDGSYAYAKLHDGQLEPTGMIAHDKQYRNVNEQMFLQYEGTLNNNAIRNHWSNRLKQRNAHRIARYGQSLNGIRPLKSPSYSTSENKKGLVILVNFADKKMRSSTVQADFEAQFNTPGYNKQGHIGSVRDYFIDQSYGKLTIDFDVVGPYTMSKTLSYYGQNDSSGDDMHAGEMVAEACKAAASDVNYSDYDWNGDGKVDQIYVLYAGYGEASGAASNTIWPHEYALSYSDYGKSLIFNGVEVDTYACSCELSGTSGSKMNSIGTACHEFSHCLGLPDFYDTNGKNFGMSTWSLMDYGCYNGPSNNDGAVPCSFTAYERFYSGWLEPIVLEDGCDISGMRDITSSEDSYIIYNDGDADEYYVLTNIQQKSWNQYAYGHGMLIIHVDYNEYVWWNNTVNNTSSHQRCTIIPADNATPTLGYTQSSWNSLGGDPYPGTSNNTSLTDSSSPSAKLFNNNADGKKLMGKPIENISEIDGLISFTFNGGNPVPVPEPQPATAISEKTFTATWSAVEGASYYMLELEESYKSEITEVLSEDFSGLSSIVNTGLDISANLDDYLSQPGWTGAGLYSGFTDSTSGIKLGTAKQVGTLTTPELTAPSSGEVTIYFVGSPYAIAPEANISVCVNDGESETFSCNGSGSVMNISNLSGKYKVTFSTTTPTRGYIKLIKIFNGTGDVEDIEASSSKERESSPSKAKRKTYYSGLTTTSYTFTDLNFYEYRYRVKAFTDDSESQWSDYVSVVLPGAADAINSVLSDSDGETVEIYNLGGVMVYRGFLSDCRNSLNHGIYIIRTNGKNAKIIL